MVPGSIWIEVRIQHDRNQSRKNPGPWTNCVMSDVEPQDRQQSLALVLGAEDALGDVAAAARFGARIPERPPLQSQIDEQRDHRQSPPCFAGESVGRVWEKAQRTAMRRSRRRRLCFVQLAQQLMQAADGANAVISDGNDDSHFENELE